MRLLIVNAGSSSIRLALYEGEIGSQYCSASSCYPGEVTPEVTLRDFLGTRSVDAAAHRIVHGGEILSSPCLIEAGVESEIERLAALAPLHNPRALEWIRACRAVLRTDLPQVAVFDTGFYATMPEVARSYALSQPLADRLGLRRYGFHGIAHQDMYRRWQILSEGKKGGRVISLQLGSGCSVTAVARGQPRDTSMGFSPLEGLVMATRSGDIDPGLLLHLLNEGDMSATELGDMLNRESGLQGMAGESDMRKLLVSSDDRARSALNLYCYRASKYIGSYLAVLGGADAILFGGGVGEHAPDIRERILSGMEWAGIVLDRRRNQDAIGIETCISRDDSQVSVWSITVDEARAIAADAADLLLKRQGA